MENTDYCDECHGSGEKLDGKCGECAGTGLKGGAYTQFQPTPKQNGWSFWHAIEFVIALIFLVFALIVTGVLKLIGKD